MKNLQLFPINERHLVRQFNSGSRRLDHYLREAALREQTRRHSVSYILSPTNSPEVVLGYYTLMHLSFKLDTFEMGGALISHLAVHEQHQYRGYGRRLLSSALLRSVRSPSSLVNGVVAEAPEPALFAFYRRYGFQELATDRSRLFQFPKAITASANQAYGS